MPIELSGTMNILYLCCQIGSYQPHVPFKHLKCKHCDREIELLILLHLNINRHVASGYLIGQCSSRIRLMSTITLPVSSPPLKPPRGSLCICRMKEELVYKTQLSPQWLLLTICFPFPVAIPVVPKLLLLIVY